MLKTISETELVINGRYRASIIPLINGAKRSIDLIMFEWRWYKQDPSSDASLINQALLRAMRRGVRVRAIVNNATQMQALKAVGFDVRTNDAGTLLHSKSIIFDAECVMMGSHNLTNNAMRANIETSLIVRNEAIAKQMYAFFNSLWQS